MKVARLIPVALITGILIPGWGHAKPFSLENGDRPSAWNMVGGNEMAWRFLNGGLNSGNGDAEDYENPSYFYMAEPADTVRADYAVEAKVRSFQENGTFTLLARFQDAQNYYGLEYRDRSHRGRVRLIKLQDGDVRYEKTVGHGYGYDNVTIPDMKVQPVRFRLEVRGNQIRGLVNDELEMLMEDDAFPTGSTGFGSFFYHFEVLDLEITDLAPPPEPTPTPGALPEAGPAWIEFRGNFSEQEAQALKNVLDSQRLSDVQVAKEGDSWIVRTGVFPSVAQAQVALDLLQTEGQTGGQVVRAGEPTILPPSVAVGEGAALALVVAEYTSQADAALHRKSLHEAGFPEAEVVRDNTTGTYKVIVGKFTAEREAAEFAAQLRQSGFTTIGTIAVARRPSPAAPEAPLPDVNELTELLVRRVLQEVGTELPDSEQVAQVLGKYSDLLDSITNREQIMRDLETRITEMTEAQERTTAARLEEEKNEIDRLLTEVEAHMAQGELEDAWVKCNRVLRMAPDNLKADGYLEDIRLRQLKQARAEALVQREEEIHARLGAAKTLVAQGNFDDARIHLNHILAAAIREQELGQPARQEIDEARQLLASVDERVRQKELDDLNRLAVEAGEKGHLNRQLEYLNEMLRLSPYDEALLARVVAVQEALNDRAEVSEKPIRKFKFILYGLVLFVILLAIFFVLSWVFYRRREEQIAEEAAKIPQLTYEPAEDNFQEEEPEFLEESVALNFGEVLSPEAEKMMVSGGGEVPGVSPGAGVAVADTPAPSPEPPPTEEEPPAEEETPPAASAADKKTPSRTESLEDLFAGDEAQSDAAPDFGDLDLLESTDTGEEPAAEEETLEPMEAPAADEALEGEEETVPEKAETPPREGVTTPSLPESVEGNLLFKQGFDDLEVGAQPMNWERSGGSLTVQSGGHGDIGKCLRFEKTGGSDAYSHCRFPGVQNIFRLEFDLNCEDNIQGGIQILIEHDEKAEGLVQVTAGEGGRELGIQGIKTESTPGEWRHIKFIINLDKHVVNGFVDGKLVAYKVPLPDAPEEINSISIMGDTPSSGSLLIDNIKIYRV